MKGLQLIRGTERFIRTVDATLLAWWGTRWAAWAATWGGGTVVAVLVRWQVPGIDVPAAGIAILLLWMVFPTIPPLLTQIQQEAANGAEPSLVRLCAWVFTQPEVLRAVHWLDLGAGLLVTALAAMALWSTSPFLVGFAVMPILWRHTVQGVSCVDSVASVFNKHL
jgi:hypothetical protein